MGRPSKKTERTDEILAAFQRCVIAQGLDATTLDDVAREARVQRATIRHFVGNREQLISAALDAMIKRYVAAYDWRIEDAGSTLEDIADFMFSPEYAHGTSEDDRLLDALISAAMSDTQLRDALKGFFVEMQARLAKKIIRDIPGTALGAAQDTAYVLVTLAEQSSQFQFLGLPKRGHAAAHQMAKNLIESLRAAQQN